MKSKKILLMTFIITVVFLILYPHNASAAILKQEISSDGTTTYYVSTKEENFLALSIIKSRMQTEAKIIYSGEIISSPFNYLNEALAYNYLPQNNVLNTSYGIGSFKSYSLSTNANDDGTITAKYNIYYLETAEQTKYVYDKIHQAIKDNLNNLETDYQKAYWAYCWVLENTSCDNTLVNRSAYQGLTKTGTVCVGYSTLYCAIANELGLECRYVVGSVNNSKINNHAWSIIKLDGKWYCVDTTWGDISDKDKFFLKTKDIFATADYGYHSSSVYDNYLDAGEIFATTDYIDSNSSSTYLTPSVYNVGMDILKLNTLSIGEGYTFMINNDNNIPISFKSDNTNVAKVDKNGVITGVGEGTTTVTAYNDSLKFSQSCVITVSSKRIHTKLSYNKIKLKTNGTFQLKVKNAVNYSSYKWSSSNKSIAKVSSSGKVTGASTGTCTITCTVTNGTSVVVLKCDVTIGK